MDSRSGLDIKRLLDTDVHGYSDQVSHQFEARLRSAQDKLYAYGFNVRPAFPSRFGHAGGAGMNAEIALYPDSGAQLISLSNDDPPAATRMLTALEK